MLTAYLKFNGQTTSRSFQMTVPQRLPFNRVAQFDFENSLDRVARALRRGPGHGQPHVQRRHGGFRRGARGPAVRLNGNNGVRLPAGLITNYEYTVSFWINPTAITRFTPAFFAAVNEHIDPAGFPFSTQWLSFLPESWDGNTMLWSGSDQLVRRQRGHAHPAQRLASPGVLGQPGRGVGVHRRRAPVQRGHDQPTSSARGPASLRWASTTGICRSTG